MFFPCFNMCSPDVSMDSYISTPTSIVESRKESSESYKMEQETGDYAYLQSQLCSDNLKIDLEFKEKDDTSPRNFSTTLKTPFGEVTVRFVYCPAQKRYNRFICGGGKYTDLLEKLDKKYVSYQSRKAIYNQILKYLTSHPVSQGTDPWKCELFKSKYENKILAYFCAILAVCDPCFGEGADGGKDVRSVLRSAECLKGCLFKKFLEPSFYPMSQRGAYRLARKLTKTPKISGQPGTYKGFATLTNNHTPSKPKLKRSATL